MIILINLLLFFSFFLFLSNHFIALVRCVFWQKPSFWSGVITSHSLLRVVSNLASAAGKIIISKMHSGGEGKLSKEADPHRQGSSYWTPCLQAWALYTDPSHCPKAAVAHRTPSELPNEVPMATHDLPSASLRPAFYLATSTTLWTSLFPISQISLPKGKDRAYLPHCYVPNPRTEPGSPKRCRKYVWLRHLLRHGLFFSGSVRSYSAQLVCPSKKVRHSRDLWIVCFYLHRVCPTSALW